MYQLALFLDGKLRERPVDAIKAIDTILRQRPGFLHTSIGRCFYTPETIRKPNMTL
jgi:hypothetical protein